MRGKEQVGSEEEGGGSLGARDKELEERHIVRDQETFHLGSQLSPEHSKNQAQLLRLEPRTEPVYQRG